MMHDVFISYSHVDKEVADSIVHRFESNGIRCWYAPRDISPGMDWREAIMSAISAARIFVLVYSKHSNQSRQVLNEVTAAFDASCVIIPFRLDEEEMSPALAYYLNTVHWMDAMLPPRSEKIDALAEKAKGILGIVPAGSERDAPTKKRTPKLWILTAAVCAVSILSLCIGIFVVPDPPSPETTAPALPFAEDPAAIDAARDSSVRVETYYQGSSARSGSGFACFDDHIIVTSGNSISPVPLEDFQHMLNASGSSIPENIRIEVITESGLTLTVTDILAFDPDHDIAILSTSGSHGLPLLEVGSTDALLAGEKLVVIGSAMEEKNIVYFFNFSGLSKIFDVDMITFAGPMAMGGSGSVVLNQEGKAVGIVLLKSSEFNYAMPIEAVVTLWEDCVEPSNP